MTVELREEWYTKESMQAKRKQAQEIIKTIDERLATGKRVYDKSKCEHCEGRGGYRGGYYMNKWIVCNKCND